MNAGVQSTPNTRHTCGPVLVKSSDVVYDVTGLDQSDHRLLAWSIAKDRFVC